VVNIEKAKPKGVSTRGTTRLFFDWKKNRYYEEGDFKDLYAFEHEKQTKGTEFREPLASPRITDDETPF
jgi:hypothetical protein